MTLMKATLHEVIWFYERERERSGQVDQNI